MLWVSFFSTCIHACRFNFNIMIMVAIKLYNFTSITFMSAFASPCTSSRKYASCSTPTAPNLISCNESSSKLCSSSLISSG
nr:MAG TPA: hypothetical protein [Caudoviricetes sp.]